MAVSDKKNLGLNEKSHSFRRILDGKLGRGPSLKEQVELAARAIEDPVWFKTVVLGELADDPAIRYVSEDLSFLKANGALDPPKLTPEPIQFIRHWAAYKTIAGPQMKWLAENYFDIYFKWAINLQVANFPILVVDLVCWRAYQHLSAVLGGLNLITAIAKFKMASILFGMSADPHWREVDKLLEHAAELPGQTIRDINQTMPLIRENDVYEWSIKNKVLPTSVYQLVGNKAFIPLVPLGLQLKDNSFQITSIMLLK